MRERIFATIMDGQRRIFVCGRVPPMIAWLFAADEQRTISFQRGCSNHAATIKADSLHFISYFCSSTEELLPPDTGKEKIAGSIWQE